MGRRQRRRSFPSRARQCRRAGDPRPSFGDGARKDADRRVHHQGAADQGDGARGGGGGVFHSALTGKSYPWLQILTLAELFAGKRPDIPYVDPSAAFKRAARETTEVQARLL